MLLLFGWSLMRLRTKSKSNSTGIDGWLKKYKRYEMVKDLIQSNIVAGKDTNEVKALIGEPDLRNDTSQIWNYNMGEGGGGLGFRMHYLVVKFTADRVIDIWHQRITD